MLDITRDKPIKVAVRVAVPVKDHPKFNFVGKLLGPKGNSLKRLQEDTMCKMAVLGRGSMKDRQKEEELRMSGDPKFSHLSEDLHVEISAFATPAEAHARIAYALAEVRRFLVPDYNDDIRQEQMLEMQILSTQQQQQSAAGHSRRLTPPDSSRSGSEETLPILDNQMGVNSIQVQSQQQSSAQQAHHQNVPHQNGHDMSNEDMTQQHHHVLGNPQITPHGVLVNAQNGGHLVTQDGRSLIQAQSANGAHILAAQNGLLGGQPDAILGLNSPLLGQAVNGVQPTLVALNGGPSGGPQVLHPALRGLKPTTVQPLNNQVGAVLGGRKRPLLGGAAGGPGRSCMSPTKRTVMSLLARARAAQAKNQPAWRGGPEHATLVPLLREDYITGVGVNINLA